MKASTLVFLILFVAGFFLSWNILITDFETQYVNTSIANVDRVSDNYKVTYDESSYIENKLTEISDQTTTIGEGSKFTEGLTGGILILGIMLSLPIIIITGTGRLVSDITGLGQLLNVPPTLMGIIAIILTAAVIFGIISMFRRYPS